MNTFYDPVKHPYPAQPGDYTQAYWYQQGLLPRYSKLTGTHQAQVLVVGGGFTGMSCALHLRQRGYQVTLIDAKQPGFGCASRNAGFVLPGTGRLSFAQMVAKWGVEQAQAIYQEFTAGIALTRQTIADTHADCEVQSSGYLKLAHHPRYLDSFRQQAHLLQTTFNDPVCFVDAQQVKQDYINLESQYGGLYFPYSFGINPAKFAAALSKHVKASGVTIYGDTPMLKRISEQGRQHKVVTPQGRIDCDTLVLASNAYTGADLDPIIQNRHFPVLSSVIVTSPLNEQQQQCLRMRDGLLAMDTRALKYYFRLLPDNRILFGGRGAISGKQAHNDVYRNRLLTALQKQCRLPGKLKADYFWSGWVSVALDDYPRVWLEPQSQVGYAMGYCGSGVAYSQLAGLRLAQQINAEPVPELPFYQSVLPRIPLSQFKRLGLWGFYQWGRFTDSM